MECRMAKKMKQALKITVEHKALRELRLSKNLSLEEAAIPLGIKSSLRKQVVSKKYFSFPLERVKV